MQKALITGAGGFIGASLARRLLVEGYEVHALVHGEANRLRGLPGALTLHKADITDQDTLLPLFLSIAPDHVFHLAASNIRSGITASAEDVVRTNVLGTKNVLDAAVAVDISSCIVMGSFLEYGAKSSAIRETDLCAPPELYSVTKLAATLLAQATAKSSGKPILAFRLFTPYGPLMQEGRLVRTALETAMRGESIALTHPSVSRDFVYIDDIVALLMEASARASEYPGEIFNLGSGEKTTLKEFAEIALSVTGSTSETGWGGYGAVSYDSDAWQADMTKTFDSFAWRPTIGLREGVERTYRWLKEIV